jgi:hypothetical protein
LTKAGLTGAEQAKWPWLCIARLSEPAMAGQVNGQASIDAIKTAKT